MTGTIAAVYENGVLRPLTPLTLAEHTRVELQIVEPASATEEERQHVRHALIEAGIIQPSLGIEPAQSVSEAEILSAAQAFGESGPLSELVISERAGR